MPQSPGSDSRNLPGMEERLLKELAQTFPFFAMSDGKTLGITFDDNVVESVDLALFRQELDPRGEENFRHNLESLSGYDHLFQLTPPSNADRLRDGLHDLAIATLVFLKVSVSPDTSKSDYATLIDKKPNGFRSTTARMPEEGQARSKTFLQCLASARELERDFKRITGSNYDRALPYYTVQFLEKVSQSKIPDLAQELQQAIEAGRGRKRGGD